MTPYTEAGAPFASDSSGMPWALKNRRAIPREVELRYRRRDRHAESCA